MQPQPLPASKDQLLTLLDGFPYNERIAYAARLGRDHKDSPALGNLIAELRTHPEPECPKMEVEEEFVKILPAQQKNVSKFFHEEQIALTAAVASKTHLDLLEKELESPSIFFKRLAAKEVVRQENDDEKLYSFIEQAVPKLRKRLIHECIRRRRVAILERLYPVLRKEVGADVVADFLHGCSSPFVSEQLKDKEIRANKALNWHGIARHHGRVIIELIREKLIKNQHRVKKEWNLASIWNKWYTRLGGASKELIHNTNLSGEILKLACEIPCVESTVSFLQRVKDAKPHQLVVVMPVFISANLDTFITHHPEAMLDVCKRALQLAETSDKRQYIKSGLGASFWTKEGGWIKLHNNKRFEWITTLAKHLLTLSQPCTLYPSSGLYYGDSADRTVFSTAWPASAFLRSFSEAQLVQFVAMGTEFLLKNRPDEKAFASWKDVEKTELKEAIDTWKGYYRKFIVGAFKELKVRRLRLLSREKELKGGKAESGTASASSNTRRARGRGRAVAAPTQKGRPRVDKLTEDQRLAALKQVDERKTKIDNAFAALLESFIEVLTKHWQWPRSVYHESEEDQASDEARNFLRSSLPILAYDHDLIMTVFDKLFPHFAKNQNYRAGGTWRETYHSYACAFLAALDREHRNEIRSQEYRDKCRASMDTVVRFFLAHYREEPVVNDSVLIHDLMRFASPVEVWQIFKLYDEDSQTHLGQNSNERLKELFDNLFRARNAPGAEGVIDFAEAWAAVTKLLDASSDISDAMKDDLKGFQNVEDHAVRKVMTKAADSNNIAERSAAYRALLKSSRLSKSVTQLRRTLQFFRTKVKNESAENRHNALRILAEDITSNIQCPEPHQEEFTALALSEECFGLWNDMLSDALESPDLSAEPQLLDTFLELSSAAIARTAGNCKQQPAFGFGFELQWRIAVFQLGERKACKKFRLRLPGGLRPTENNPYFPVGSEAQFVEAIVEAYSAKVADKNPHFFEKASVLAPLYDVVGKKWQDIPTLVEHLQRVLAKLKEKSKRDAEGLYIIKRNHEAISLFEKVFALHDAYRGFKGEEWYDIPVLVEYVDTLLRSREARRVFLRWLNKNSRGTTRAERQRNRGQCVDTLLGISPSAIYLRPVWRFLVRFRQNKLDSFLNPKQTFRGVFYLEADNRGPLAPAKSTRDAWWSTLVEADAREQIKKEKKKEMKVQKEKKAFEEEHMDEEGFSREFEHEDYFLLPACYGLRRLLPRQLERLAAQRMDRVLDPDRDLPTRVTNAIHWTLLPSTTYGEVVSFYESHEKGPDEFPVNILEAVLRGTMQSDEPCVPLQFLLSPKFLSSDRARVAMYCVSKCVPYMPSPQMTETLLMVLTGKRRNSLKVTAYKEVIRILAGRPTEKHMQMVLHEWQRDKLHRDVRIAILQKSIGFLIRDVGEEIAWKILESVVVDHKDNAEILTALLGVVPATLNSYKKKNPTSGVFRRSRLSEHWDQLSKSKVPDRHGSRFFNSIVKPLSHVATDDDVKFLATFVSVMWIKYVEDKEEVMKQLYAYVTNTGLDVLNDPKADVQKVHDQRFRECVKDMLNIAGLNDTVDYAQVEELREYAVRAIETLCRAVREEIPLEEREARVNLFQRIQFFVDSLSSSYYGPIHENLNERLIAPLKEMNGMFFTTLARRMVNRVNPNSEFSAKARPIVHQLLCAAEGNPIDEAFVVEQIVALINKCSGYWSSAHEHARALVCDMLRGESLSEDQPASPTYTRLLTQTTMELLPKFTALFDESTKDTTREMLRRFMAYDAEDATAWISGVETKAQKVHKLISDLCNSCEKRGATSTRRLLEPRYKALIGDVVDLALSSGHNDDQRNVSTEVAYLVLEKLAHNNAWMLVASESNRLCTVLKCIADSRSRNPTQSDAGEVVSMFRSVLQAVEESGRLVYGRSSHGYDPKSEDTWAKAHDSTETVLTVSTVELMSAILRNALSTSDPVVTFDDEADEERKKSLQEDVEEQRARSRKPYPAYDNVLYQVGVELLGDYYRTVLQRKELGAAFCHKAIVRSCAYADRTPQSSTGMSTILFILKKAYAYRTDLTVLQDDLGALSFGPVDETKPKAAFDAAAADVLEFITRIKSLSLVNASVGSSDEQPLPFPLGPYRKVSLHFAVDLLQYFGDRTAVPLDNTTASDGEDKMDVEEPEKEPKKKKKKATTIYLWRPEYVAMLDELCKDEDESVRYRALNTVTRRVVRS